MKTNYLMLKELLSKYEPQQRGIMSCDEFHLIKETLHLEDMDVLALKNLRDFVVMHLSHSKSLVDWDRMSAITCCIDSKIIEAGGEV